MIDDSESQSRDPWRGADDPETIAAVGAELERIVGVSASPGPDASGVKWALPVASIDELLAFLKEIPSNIGMESFEARLRDRSGGLPTPNAAPPDQHSQGGA